METWNVTVSRSNVVIGELKVQAEDENQAWDLAEEELNKDEKTGSSNIVWDSSGLPDGAGWVEELMTEEESRLYIRSEEPEEALNESDS